MDTHTQCRLRQGRTQTVSWIPTKVAVRGKTVRLKDETGWALWEVLEVWSTRPSDWVIAQSRDHKYHRRATDI